MGGPIAIIASLRLRDFTGKVGITVRRNRRNYGVGLHLGLCVLKEQAHDAAKI